MTAEKLPPFTQFPMYKTSLRLSVASLLLVATFTSAQRIYDYTGMGGNSWTNTASWVIEPFPEFPNSPEALVRFGTLQNPDSDRANILFSSALLNPPVNVQVGAFVFLPELNTIHEFFYVRSSSTTVGTHGTLHIHGLPYMVNGEEVNLLIGNFGTTAQTWFTNANQGMTIKIYSSGVIHVEEGSGQGVKITNQITNDGEPRAITKTGPGRLFFETNGQLSDYGGGFTIAEGIVEWSNSGGRAANPWGGNNAPMTLISGTLRSSSTGSRTVGSPIDLRGDFTFGSEDPAFNGSIAINSQGGAHRTNVFADSTITVHNTLTWHQRFQGTGNLTKAGPGILVLASTSVSTLEGTFTVAEGTLRMSTAFGTIPVLVKEGASIEGAGEANAGLTLEANTVISPGLSTARGTLTAGPLTLTDSTTLHIVIDNADPVTGYSSLTVTGPADLAGAHLEVTLNFDPNPELHPPLDTAYVLVNNVSGVAVSGTLTWDGAPLTEGTVITVSTGSDSRELEITYNYNKGGHSRSVALIPPGSGGGASGYEGWREARFGNTTDPAGDPLAQPVGQAVANLLLYGLGLDLAADSAAGLPVAVGEQAIRFTRRSDLAVRLVVEGISGNPTGSWETLATLEAGASTWSGSANVAEVAAGPDLVQVTATDTVGSTTGVRLLRVRAVLP